MSNKNTDFLKGFPAIFETTVTVKCGIAMTHEKASTDQSISIYESHVAFFFQESTFNGQHRFSRWFSGLFRGHCHGQMCNSHDMSDENALNISMDESLLMPINHETRDEWAIDGLVFFYLGNSLLAPNSGSAGPSSSQ